MLLTKSKSWDIIFDLFLLVAGIVLALAVIIYIKPEEMAVGLAFTILAGVLLWFRLRLLKPGHAKTASAAIVMSMGVFTSDAMNKFPGFIPSIGKLTVLIVFVIWLFLMIDYTIVIFKKEFFENHWVNPLNSFAMGTWIASSSVCSMGIFMYLRYFSWVAAVIITVNTIFWVIYAVHSVIQYKRLLKMKTSLVHGIVFLATVSTQSLVVDYSVWILGKIPLWVSWFFILIGIVFYILFIILLVKRHVSLPWHLTQDWNNTNCTIHGALSITGLAAIESKTIPVMPVLILWWVVFALFIVIEGIEVYRAMNRYKKMGFRLALGTYHVSQWTRNFTFSMFLAFTIHLPIVLSSSQRHLFNGVTDAFGLIIIFLFIYEAVLYFKETIVYRNI